jgi:TonB family protein
MRTFVLLVPLMLVGVTANSQSGRKAPKTIPQPTPAVEETKPAPVATPDEALAPVTAEKKEFYRCTTDGSLARVIDENENMDHILSSKVVDVRAVILEKPRPSYTREASKAGIQGFVILKVELTANGEIGRVGVVRRLPYGLTENAIRVACKIKFKPAMKDGVQVSQWLNVEYAFRLADSSIYQRRFASAK